jgi:hypothetical protein
MLLFRPDNISHNAPAADVARRNPGLLVDHRRVLFGLLAARMGHPGGGFPGGTGPGAAIERAGRYLPLDAATRLYLSDADSVTRAMASLAVLFGDGALRHELDAGYRVFNLANRWQTVTCADLRAVCAALDPAATAGVHHVTPEVFRETVRPRLSAAERLYHSTFIEPFAGYLNRPRTDPQTENVDAVLGPDWHRLHPAHGRDARAWLAAGLRQAFDRRLPAGARDGEASPAPPAPAGVLAEAGR